MPATRLYHNASCSKSRAALELLRQHGIEPEIVDYRRQPPSVAELRELLRLLGVPATDLLRGGDADAMALGLGRPGLGEDAILDALHAHPHLMQRPVVVCGGRALVARPPERVLELMEPSGDTRAAPAPRPVD